MTRFSFRTGNGCRRRHVAGVLALLVVAFCIMPAAAPLAEGMLYGKGLLWKITKKGRVAGHVLGTMHLSDERIRDIPKPVLRALARSESMSVEMILEHDDQHRVQRLMNYSGNKTLEKVLGPELFAKVVKAVSPAGLAADDIRQFKPWYVSSLVNVHPDEAMRQSGGRIVLDAALANIARSRGLPLHGLETFDEHFALFDSMTEEDQIKMLRLSLKGTHRIRQYYEYMVRLYLDRDLRGIMRVTGEFMAGLDPELRKAFEEKLLYARNKIMVRRMQKQFREGDAFVAIGAAHLPGHRGVLYLLEKRGYRVARVY